MNINSISELSNAVVTTAGRYTRQRAGDDIPGVFFRQQVSALSVNYFKDPENAREVSGENPISCFGVDLLSCPQNTYIEVSQLSNGNKVSRKFDFSLFLEKLNRTLAWVVDNQLNALTKEDADKYYVPMSGTSQAKPMTGPLHISGDGNTDVLLSVHNGNIQFVNQTNAAAFEVNAKNSSNSIEATTATFTNLTATNSNISSLTANNLTVNIKANIKNLIVDEKTETQILSATNLTADNLTANITANIDNLNVVETTTTTNLTATDSNISSLTATGITADTLCCSDSATLDTLCAGHSGNSYALTVLNEEAGNEYITFAQSLSATKIDTLTFSADKLVAKKDFQVGVGTENTVTASISGNAIGLSARKLQTPNFGADNITANSELYVGDSEVDGARFSSTAQSGTKIKSALEVSGTAIFGSTADIAGNTTIGGTATIAGQVTMNNGADVNGAALTAGADIAVLTAKAACWS